MEKNIFEGVKFGDKFLTRDGSLALFIKWDNGHPVLIDKTFRSLVRVHQDGWFWKDHEQETPSDIVSRYHEPIDFDKLHELANKLCPLEGFSNAEEGFIDEREDIENSWVDGFKAGYRKAMEE